MKEFDDAGVLESEKTFSNVPQWVSQSHPSFPMVDNVTVNIQDAGGTTLSSHKSYFHVHVAVNMRHGREYKSEILDPITQAVLRRTETKWEQREPFPWCSTSFFSFYFCDNSTDPNGGPPVDPRITEIKSTLETAQVTKKTFSYDQYNNVTDTYEYDFGEGQPGPFLRRTHAYYVTDANYTTTTGSYLLRLKSQTWVSSDINGASKAALTVFEYDNYAADTHHAPLLLRNNVSGFDVNYQAGFTRRGNLTSVTSFSNAQNQTGPISSYSQYDILGNIVKTIDGRDYATTFDFSDRFGAPDTEAQSNNPPAELATVGKSSYAFATKITNALGQSTYLQFDHYLGRSINAEDINGVVSSSAFDDPLDRPTQTVKAANDPAAKSRGGFAYDDVNRALTTTSDQSEFNDTHPLKSQTLYDSFGRAIESRLYEGETNYIAARVEYDALGRAFKTSNPFRSAETIVWTTSAFDALGRVISITTPDNAVRSTAYVGDRVLVTDQVGKQRISKTNALGQLKDIWEVTPADPATAAISFLNHPEVMAGYHTSYSYDTLDNLTAVNQGSQTRTFVYDSLKRLTSTQNPESGTIDYQYDATGNLTQKIDPRLLPNQTHITTYVYDAMNRLTSRTYTDGTPAVTYTYDAAGVPNGKGRLTSVSSSVSTYSYSNYDPAGNVLGGSQTIGAQTYTMAYSYDLAGHIKTIGYPSGNSVTYNYDRVGRLADENAQNLAFTGNLGDGTLRIYSTGISYSSMGGLQEERFGTATPIYHKQRFNARGQLWDMRASTVSFSSDPANGDRGAIVNYYSNNFVQGGSGADNNGNLLRQENYIPGSNYFQQTFDYDPLNRLNWVEEKLNGAGNPSFKQAYVYDRWGNRTIDYDGTTPGIPRPQFDTNDFQFTNRLYAPGDTALPMDQRQMRYDSAGNLNYDAYTGQGTRVYDAENRMTSAGIAGAPPATYAYDGDGRRIKRIVNGIETLQVYGIGGELLAEYDAANASPSNPQKEYGYRNGELLITAEAGVQQATERTNVALASNGATASASSSYTGTAASGTINADRKGLNYGQNGTWASAGAGFPQWLQVDFNVGKTIDEIDVFTVQDNWQNPGEPTETMPFSLYGITAFTVEYWTGTTWVTVPGGSISGNDKVWRKITFSPIMTSKIKVTTSASASGWSEITEVEAWGNAAPVATNVARASNGGTASASSAYGGLAPSGGIDGNRMGSNYGQNTTWGGATATFPQWLQVDFNGSKRINEIDVFTLQDNYQNPSEPTETMTFSQYGITGFTVEYWTGTTWATVPGGSISDNNKVWRKITFSPITTSKIKVTTSASASGWSEITEVEAWTASQNAANIHWLVTDHLGTSRMVFDQTGSLANVSRHDYLPFGEEVPDDFRSGIPGYGTSDKVRQKFTQYERDLESGLDFAQARYYANVQGRFTSPDPLAGSATIPQSLNAYSYVINNPLNATDPTGLSFGDVFDTGNGYLNAFYIDGVLARPEQALWMLGSGTGVVAPFNTTRYDTTMRTFVSLIAIEGPEGTGTGWIPHNFKYIGDFSWGWTNYDPNALKDGDPTSYTASFQYMRPESFHWYRGELVTTMYGAYRNAHGDAVHYLTQAVETDWGTQMAIGSGLNALRLGLRGLITSALAQFGKKSAVDKALDAAVDFLGSGTRTITNRAGDKIFLSKDGIRRIRFDFKRPYPHKNPHIHVEEKVNGVWQGPRIYPQGLKPE